MAAMQPNAANQNGSNPNRPDDMKPAGVGQATAMASNGTRPASIVAPSPTDWGFPESAEISCCGDSSSSRRRHQHDIRKNSYTIAGTPSPLIAD
ncbi:hypothetical protein [Bifidobacterium sp.]|jgi:hypothetical protein|uniref:hypothetical protein n=1 Tax=Bifidobacterium sp. TaxID=41200 RepID=UPI0025C69747|nr:hypothetical protein [Bifidobacterium sp.]MCI1225203.1 hypothetical protein [Bifidobacterium sp.]